MKGEIQGLIAKCKVAAKQPAAYGFLPDIIGELEDIKSELEKDQPNPERLLLWARGLGRLVTDSYAFSESPLGTELLELADDVVRKYAWRFPRFR
ncbi:hypothetical protein EG19_12025 [Thermoanaerobaculum aquaticum]|jgi:hypothetical protein|uniref:Uncharacterized protein n=1 Tax=Thermoanaerobaculum aquaticum TaxID=1312852 RepID=A0A062Y235_9BACT|nr:hypothetical protein [Thermoanaerobaculum aquaticum]KDA54436.1 hypothetical protein EG19_12025 [Thermoanaerobaculum aquaticum]